jgi:hypothetical protein
MVFRCANVQISDVQILVMCTFNQYFHLHIWNLRIRTSIKYLHINISSTHH